MAEHSPGPWTVDYIPGAADPDDLDHARHEIDDAHGNLVATINHWPKGYVCRGRVVPGCGGDPEANARLIASAPDLKAAADRLAAACRAALARLLQLGAEEEAARLGKCPACQEIRAALAAYEGKG